MWTTAGGDKQTGRRKEDQNIEDEEKNEEQDYNHTDRKKSTKVDTGR